MIQRIRFCWTGRRRERIARIPGAMRLAAVVVRRQPIRRLHEDVDARATQATPGRGHEESVR